MIENFNTDHLVFFEEIKKKIRIAQITAAVKTNQVLIKLYWDIGKSILEKERNNGWGSKVTDRMAEELKKEFPSITGFSARNLHRMKRFFEIYEHEDINHFTSIPWGHNMLLLEKLDNFHQRLWYAQKVIQNGWSRSMLLLWIDSDLYSREGKAISNFDKVLPQPQSDVAREILKDPYCFDFLTLKEDAHERELEQGLAANVQKLLLELGTGFAFVGRQYKIEVDNEEYFIDLLFYHFLLKSFVVVELKTTAFKPEYVGKLNFYLAALDNTLKPSSDNPSIGMLLCKNRKQVTVEYALQNLMSPMGIASYTTKISNELPELFKSSLPTSQQIERLLNDGDNESIYASGQMQNVEDTLSL